MTRLRLALVAMPTLILLSGWATWPGSPRPETLPFTASPPGRTGPMTAGSGYVRLSLRNESTDVMAAELVRIKDGVTPAEGMRAVRVLWHVEAGDTAAALAKLDGFYGGAVFVGPGEMKWVATTLSAGNYVAYVDHITPKGPILKEGYLAPLEVRATPAPLVAPKPRHLVRMVDFDFSAPDSVVAGNALWRMENRGGAPHVAFVGKLHPGKTIEDVRAAFAARQPGVPSAFDQSLSLRGVHALTPGQYNDVELDLTPGTYVVACVIGGHHHLGMLKQLTVVARSQ